MEWDKVQYLASGRGGYFFGIRQRDRFDFRRWTTQTFGPQAVNSESSLKFIFLIWGFKTFQFFKLENHGGGQVKFLASSRGLDFLFGLWQSGFYFRRKKYKALPSPQAVNSEPSLNSLTVSILKCVMTSTMYLCIKGYIFFYHQFSYFVIYIAVTFMMSFSCYLGNHIYSKWRESFDQWPKYI